MLCKQFVNFENCWWKFDDLRSWPEAIYWFFASLNIPFFKSFDMKVKVIVLYQNLNWTNIELENNPKKSMYSSLFIYLKRFWRLTK